MRHPELPHRVPRYRSDEREPYDFSDPAEKILRMTAEAIAPAMMPLAELAPNEYVVMNNQSIAASTTAPTGVPIAWPRDGFLVSIIASTRDGNQAASMGGVLMRVTIAGNDELFPQGATSGGSGYMSLYTINSQLGRLPLRKKFYQAGQWTLYLQNITSGTVVVDLAFGVVTHTIRGV